MLIVCYVGHYFSIQWCRRRRLWRRRQYSPVLCRANDGDERWTRVEGECGGIRSRSRGSGCGKFFAVSGSVVYSFKGLCETCGGTGTNGKFGNDDTGFRAVGLRKLRVLGRRLRGRACQVGPCGRFGMCRPGREIVGSYSFGSGIMRRYLYSGLLRVGLSGRFVQAGCTKRVKGNARFKVSYLGRRVLSCCGRRKVSN